MRLLKLPAEIQLGLVDRRLDMGHARALLAVADPKVQLKLYQLILDQGLSVRRVEEMAKQVNEQLQRGEKPKIPRKAAPAADNSHYDFFRRELEKVFPTPVKFRRKADGKGSITLKFDNDDQLQTLVQLFEKLK